MRNNMPLLILLLRNTIFLLSWQLNVYGHIKQMGTYIVYYKAEMMGN